VPSRNREKQLEYQRRHYAKNKEKVKAAVYALKRKYREKWREFKATLKCVNCWFNHPAALDFHHVTKSPSNRPVNQLLRKDAYRAVAEEIKKCVVLCANCHRVHHHEERANKKLGGRSKHTRTVKR